jgi:hypothetical protein
MAGSPPDKDKDGGDDDEKEREKYALVRKADSSAALVRQAPEMDLAPSLEKASSRSFVHIDGHGQVRSPARYRALNALSYGAAATLVTLVTVAYGALLGLPGVLLGLGLGGWIGWHVRRRMRIQDAVRHMVHDQLDEAETILKEILSSFRLPRRDRALAEQNLAGVYSRRGDYEEALRHQRIAMQLYAKASLLGSRRPLVRVVEYAEVMTLVNLNRVGEARHRLERLQMPQGDYLRVLHWAAEMYVGLCDNDHRLTIDELHERSRVALTMTGGAALLGLCAWANLFSRQEDEAWHLLREAYDRQTGMKLDKTMPHLWKWMEAHRIKAGAAPADI